MTLESKRNFQAFKYALGFSSVLSEVLFPSCLLQCPVLPSSIGWLCASYPGREWDGYRTIPRILATENVWYEQQMSTKVSNNRSKTVGRHTTVLRLQKSATRRYLSHWNWRGSGKESYNGIKNGVLERGSDAQGTAGIRRAEVKSKRIIITTTIIILIIIIIITIIMTMTITMKMTKKCR